MIYVLTAEIKTMTINNFMVKLEETSDGRIIEVPDIILFGAAILLFVLFFTLATKNK